MRSANGLHQSTGLTLIEVLVALSILSIVVAIGSTSLALSMRAWASEERTLSRIQVETGVLEILRQQIKGALPMRTAETGNAMRLAFEGDAGRLQFVSRASFQEGYNGIPRWVQLSWNNSSLGEAGKIIVEERRLLPGHVADAQTQWKEAVLKAADFHLDYLTLPLGGHSPEWLASWSGGEVKTLPAAVRMRFVTGEGKRVELLIGLDYSATNAKGFWLP